MASQDNFHATTADARRALELQPEPYVQLFKHGTMTVGWYAPGKFDPQKPHEQDELYVIAAGRGTFACRDQREPFEPGSVLFAPAGAPHRFEDFSDDFATWVIFYGKLGGE